MMPPMMSDAEIEIIRELLTRRMRCLEYGAGGSTIYFPQLVRKWESREHNPEYVEKISDYLSPFAHLVYAPEKEKYITLTQDYDFILVDGVYRKECLHEAMAHLTPKGFVLLHDACRLEYKDWVNDFPNELLIEGEIAEGNGYYKHRGIRKYAKQ